MTEIKWHVPRKRFVAKSLKRLNEILSTKEELQEFVGAKKLFEYDWTRCAIVPLQEIKKWIKDIVTGEKTNLHASGDTIVIWLEDRKRKVAELYVITRGKVFFTMPITKDELESFRKRIKTLKV
jgi:Leu/Phe-tRNA-protein transferase